MSSRRLLTTKNCWSRSEKVNVRCGQTYFLENIHSLDLINFVYIVVLDVGTALETAKLVILEWLQLQLFFALPSHSEGQIRKSSSGKFSDILQNPKCHLCPRITHIPLLMRITKKPKIFYTVFRTMLQELAFILMLTR